jgi:hypothetical protein
LMVRERIGGCLVGVPTFMVNQLSSLMVRERIGGCLVGVSFRGMLPTFMVNQLLLNLKNASWFDSKMHYTIS